VKTQGRSVLLRDSAAALSAEGLPLTVLHDVDSYPDAVGSDLDCLCRAPRRIPEVLAKYEIEVVQAIEMGPDAFYFVVRRSRGDDLALAALDVGSDYRRDGVLMFRYDELAAKPHPGGDVLALPPAMEFVTYMVKQIVKQQIDSGHATRLTALFRLSPAECRRQLRRLFSARDARLLERAAGEGRWREVDAALGRLRRALLLRQRTASPVDTIRTWYAGIRRRIRRLRQPAGLRVAFAGVNSQQASAIVDCVIADIAPAFWHVHLTSARRRNASSEPRRPAWLPRVAALPPLLLLHLAAYWTKTFLMLVRATLVVTVDDRPAAAGGWTLSPLGLEPPIVIELTEREEGSRLPAEAARNRLVVSAGRPVDESRREIRQVILRRLTVRTLRRLGIPVRNGLRAVAAEDVAVAGARLTAEPPPDE
jgi:hypothetical protein